MGDKICYQHSSQSKVLDFIKFDLVEVAFMQFFKLVVVGRKHDVLESPVGMKVDVLWRRDALV